MKIENLPNEPPYYLKGTARSMWRRIVPKIKEQEFVNELDRTMVETFCINYQLMREAYDSLKEEGMHFQTENGWKKNPAVQVLDVSSKNLRAIGAELGLTPVSRAKILEIPIEGETKDLTETLKELGVF
ncbi:phage terminase small subunit P27 family [Enterococcus hirae]|nr:phage terminase small subunit P27 family [Enterococcus hirae]